MNTFIKWLKSQNEFIPLIVALLLFYFSPILLRMLDPTAGVYDVGVLQVNITAIISLCVCQAVVWLMLKVNWPSLRDYFENEFTNNFQTLTPWQKTITSLSVYFLLLLSIVVLSRVL